MAQIKKIIIVDKNVEKWEPSYLAGVGFKIV